MINVLRFIGAIDKEGKQTNEAMTVFSHHNDADFQRDFEKMVKTAYSDLFDLHNDAAWGLDGDKLIAFFRSKDKTTDLVGRLQASTFQLLAGGMKGIRNPRAHDPGIVDDPDICLDHLVLSRCFCAVWNRPVTNRTGAPL